MVASTFLAFVSQQGYSHIQFMRPRLFEAFSSQAFEPRSFDGYCAYVANELDTTVFILPAYQDREEATKKTKMPTVISVYLFIVLPIQHILKYENQQILSFLNKILTFKKTFLLLFILKKTIFLLRVESVQSVMYSPVSLGQP